MSPYFFPILLFVIGLIHESIGVIGGLTAVFYVGVAMMIVAACGFLGVAMIRYLSGK